nr:hypothetical protein [[Ochrobactrum] quorumnocens]
MTPAFIVLPEIVAVVVAPALERRIIKAFEVGPALMVESVIVPFEPISSIACAVPVTVAPFTFTVES